MHYLYAGGDMKVDKTSMLFTDMTDGEAEFVFRTAEKIILHGIIDWQRPPVVEWMNECCYNENQRFLMAATAMPQKFLLSYANHLRAKT